MENHNGSLAFTATLDIDDFKVSAEAMEKHIKKVSDTATKESASMENSIQGFAKRGAQYIVTYLVGMGMQSLLQSVIQTRGQFQQLEISFETMLGSATKGKALMDQLTQTAARTPFDLLGVAGGAKQLLAYGESAEKVNDTLVRLGNIASGLSIPLGDIVYLYGTTMTQGRLYAQDLNQFTGRGIPMVKELAAVMGVAEDKVKDLVSEGKVGFPEVEQVIQRLTNKGGMFYNLMEEQSKSLTGMISNLGDAWDSSLNKVGRANQDIFATGISGATFLAENLEEILRIVRAIAIAYGTYKAAIVLNTLALKGYTGVAFIDNTVRQAKIALMNTEIVKTKSLTVATKSLWATMKANPIGWIVSLIGLAVSAFSLFKSKEDDVQQSSLGLANATKKANEEFAAQASKVDALQKVLNDSNQTYEARNKALKKLKDIIPGYNAEISKEGKIINDNNNAIRAYLTNLERQIKLKAAQEELEEAYRQKRLKEKEIPKRQAAYEAAKKNIPDVAYGDGGAQYQLAMIKETAKAKDEWDKAENELKHINTVINDLNAEIAETSISLTDSTTKTKTYAEQVAETKQKIKDLNKEIKDLRSGNIAKENLAAEIDAKIKELNKAKGDLELLTGVKEKKQPAQPTKEQEKARKEFDEEIAYRKKQYALYYRWIETVGADAANFKFRELLKEGKSFSAWINSQVTELQQRKAQDPDAFSATDQDKLYSLQIQQNEINGVRSAMDVFQDTIKKTINQAATLAEKIEAIAEAKEKLAKGDFRLNPDQTLQAQNQLDAMDKDSRSQLNDAILNDFKSYEEKKNEIIANYSAMRLTDIANNNAELLERINKGEADALSALNAEQLKASQDWKDLFANLDTLSASEIQKLIKSIESQMANADLKLNPADYQALIESLNKAKDKVVELNPFKSLGNAFDSYINATRRLKNAEEENLSPEQVQILKREIQNSAQAITKSLGDINQVIGSVGSSMSSLASSFGNDDLAATISGVTDVLGGAGEAAMGVGKIMSGDVLGGITGVIGGISGVIGAFNKMHDKKNEKRIKRMQEQVDQLALSYDNLGDSIARAYSTDKAAMLEQQNENLQQQNELIKKQIQEEKNKKDTDWDRIKDWEDQIRENEKEIAENTKYNIIESIMGTDIASAIDDFANAYADAWAKGEQAAGKSMNVVKNLIKTAILEQLKNKLKPEVEAFMKYLSDALEDGIISESEERLLEEYEKKLEDMSDDYLSKNDKWLKDEEEIDKTDDPLKGAVRSMSEETGGVIAGRLNAFVINQAEQTAALRENLMYNAQIAQNTYASATELREIKTTLKRIESRDNSLLSQGIE